MNSGDQLGLDEIVARLESNELEWHPFQPGVDIHPLWDDPTGASSALLRYAQSPDGCVALLVWRKPNTFLEQRER